MWVQRKIYFAAIGLALEKSRRYIYCIISGSFLVFGASISLLFPSAFLCQKHEVEIHGALRASSFVFREFLWMNFGWINWKKINSYSKGESCFQPGLKRTMFGAFLRKNFPRTIPYHHQSEEFYYLYYNTT